jgi:hypothetical protein
MGVVASHYERRLARAYIGVAVTADEQTALFRANVFVVRGFHIW